MASFKTFECSSFFVERVWPNIELHERPLHMINGNKTVVLCLADPDISVKENRIYIGNDHASFSGRAGRDIYLLSSGFTGASSKMVSWHVMGMDVVQMLSIKFSDIGQHLEDISHVALRILDWHVIPLTPRQAVLSNEPVQSNPLPRDASWYRRRERISQIKSEEALRGTTAAHPRDSQTEG